nr:9031_t:CDS:2 [Entrophospora candida]
MQQLYSENKQQKIIMTVNNNNSRGSSVPNFEYVSYDRVQDLYEQNKGTLYFIPEGFEPVLVPNDSKAQAVTNLLENAKPVSAAPNVPRMLPDTDVRLPSFALPVGVAGPAPKSTSSNTKNKVKKPPRPPNAFILYRRAKQPGIVAKNQGISNNDVSKEIGRMWHEEPPEVRQKFQRMADAAKQEHMKKYPEYRYRPRRPQERKRRVQPREESPQGDLHLHLPPQNFSAQNLSMLDASSFYPPATTARRISSTISSLDVFTDDNSNNNNSNNHNNYNHNSNNGNHHHHGSLINSPQRMAYLENSNEFNNNRNLNYYDNTSNYDIDSPVSSTNTSIVNDQSGGMINLNAYDISQNGTGDYINYLELAAATDYQLYDGYDHFTTYIPPAADQLMSNVNQF